MMDGDEEGGGPRLSKRFSDQGGGGGGGEVDYKTKSGTAWSHSYLNQKPWHPLSYPNQRRKWIAEQTDAHRLRRAQEVAREFTQEQEFFRQTSLISKKEKEKVEMMKAVSFMYVRPPGYNAESAKAAELEDERKKEEQLSASERPTDDASVSMLRTVNEKNANEGKKKSRPKDVFGRALPTEEEFEVLKNAPRMETGMPARVKPFGIEVRNVKCIRCSMYGHQSGDRECPLRDVITSNEESRLKRDDPLTAIVAQTDPGEPLKWELKQKPGMSPPRGGFRPDDPNQQIVAEDIFDEYGGFLSGGSIPDLLANFSAKTSSGKHSRKRSKHRNKMSEGRCDANEDYSPSSEPGSEKENKELKKWKGKNRYPSDLSALDHSGSEGEMRRPKRRKDKRWRLSVCSLLDESACIEERRSRKRGEHFSDGSSSSKEVRRKTKKRKDKRHRHLHFSDTSLSDYSSAEDKKRRTTKKRREKKRHRSEPRSSDDSTYDHYHRRRKHH